MFKLNREKYCVYSKTKMLLFICTLWCFVCCLNSVYLLPGELKLGLPFFESISNNLIVSISLFTLLFINSILGIHALLLRYIYLIKIWLFLEILQWLLCAYTLYNTTLLNFSFGFAVLFASSAYFSLKELCDYRK